MTLLAYNGIQLSVLSFCNEKSSKKKYLQSSRYIIIKIILTTVCECKKNLEKYLKMWTPIFYMVNSESSVR